MHVLDAKSKAQRVLTTCDDASVLAVAWDKSGSRIAVGTSAGRLEVHMRKGKLCYSVRSRERVGSCFYGVELYRSSVLALFHRFSDSWRLSVSQPVTHSLSCSVAGQDHCPIGTMMTWTTSLHESRRRLRRCSSSLTHSPTPLYWCCAETFPDPHSQYHGLLLVFLLSSTAMAGAVNYHRSDLNHVAFPRTRPFTHVCSLCMPACLD